MRAYHIALLAGVVAGCTAIAIAPVKAASAAPVAKSSEQSLNRIARDFVRQTLEIGEHDPGFVDAYYGPPELQAEAKAHPPSIADLRVATDALLARVNALHPAGRWPLRRQIFLRSQLTAERTRLRMLAGEKIPFTEEAKGLFGVTPDLKPLASYDPVLARIAKLVPGDGDLADRVDAYESKFDIPKAKLEPVMNAGLAECRRRTLQHIRLPANERFDLAFVTNKPWGGYNAYLGDAHSRIDINTDLPIRISRAIDLGCHEGYPGHHVYNALLERNLTKGRNWIEFSVYPLYSPVSLIAEGSANYGVELAFPGDEQVAFETATLYPLAGLPAAEAERFYKLQRAKQELSGARFTISADYLDGKINREQAVVLSQKYGVQSRARAEKSLDFADAYRSYIINYGLGQDIVRAYVEAAGPNQNARWARMEKLLSEPMTPADVMRR